MAFDGSNGERPMKLLRDEGGYVLVLRRPQFVLVGTDDEEKEQPTVKPVLVAPRATCSVPHCCFHCQWCGEQILLPNDRIGAPFGNPTARKIEVRSIATVCLRCKHIGNYSMFRGCRGFDTRHKIVNAPNEGKTSLLNWLQCIESTCPAKVPLFLNVTGDSAEMAEEAAGWFWEGMTCALGHRINKIPLDPTIELPLRGFNSYR